MAGAAAPCKSAVGIVTVGDAFEVCAPWTAARRKRQELPRARLREPDGRTREWHSAVLERYSRRTRRVDEGSYRGS